MNVISKHDIKETVLFLAEELDLDRWETSSDLQIYLKCGEILKIKYLGFSWDDEYTYQYKIKYMELGDKMLDLIESHNFKEKCLWKIEDIKLNNPVILNQLEKEILRKNIAVQMMFDFMLMRNIKEIK